MHTKGSVLRRALAGMVAGLALAAGANASHATMISLAFENTGDAQLDFDRTDSGGGVGTFSFSDATIGGGAGSDFLITTAGNAALLNGKLDGTFTIGSIMDNGLPSGTTGYTEIASVSGSGAFSISDGLGNSLTATLGFSTISTTFLGAGQGMSFGNASSGGGISLSGISYSGSNPVLQELAASGGASLITSFAFDPSQSLRDLTANGIGSATTSVSYTGALSASASAGDDDGPLHSPAPPSAVLLGMGVLAWAVPGWMRRRRTLAA